MRVGAIFPPPAEERRAFVFLVADRQGMVGIRKKGRPVLFYLDLSTLEEAIAECRRVQRAVRRGQRSSARKETK